MAKNDIFVHFPFFRIPNQWKKCMQNWNILLRIFCFSMFSFSIKNEKQKIEIYYIEFVRSKP